MYIANADVKSPTGILLNVDFWKVQQIREEVRLSEFTSSIYARPLTSFEQISLLRQSEPLLREDISPPELPNAYDIYDGANTMQLIKRDKGRECSCDLLD